MYNMNVKILNRYLIKELSPPFFFGLVLFTFILLMDKIIYLTDLFITKRVNFSAIILLFTYLLPSFFAITIPMAVLIGVLMTFGRLSADNEITAIKASGISFRYLVIPLLIISLLFTLLTFLVINTLLPRANYAFKNLFFHLIHKSPVIELEERTFLDIGKHRLYIDKIKRKKSLMQGITVYETEEKKLPKIITAREGKWITETSAKSKITLKLIDGTIHKLDKENPDKYQEITFDTHDLNLEVAEDFNPGKASISAREMSMKDLKKRISEYRKRRIKVNSLLVELYKKVSIPFACLVFTLLGIALGTVSKRGDKTIGFGISLVLILFYYLFLALGETIGKKGILSPLLAVWLPNIILGSAGIFLLFRVMRK